MQQSNLNSSMSASNNQLAGMQHLNPNAQSQQAQVPGAPPINRLVDMLNKTSFTPSAAGGFNTPGEAMSASTRNASISNKFTSADYYVNSQQHDLPFTPIGGVGGRLSPPSPNQIDPFYSYGESIKLDEKLDECWITIFGFPPSATSYVLQEFSVYGQIVKHVVSVGFVIYLL